MSSMAAILDKHGSQYVRQHGKNMPANHKRTIRDIMLCRTPALGRSHWWCEKCAKEHFSYQACKNRHCPQCDNHKASAWLDKQHEKLLPAPYFMLTFTVPQELRRLFRSSEKIMYTLFFRATSLALQTLANDPRFLGSDIAMIAVLHTWTRMLEYHPHIHYIIPGIAISPDKKRIIFADDNFLLHYKPLSHLFRNRFKKLIRQEALGQGIPTSVWEKEWGVHVKSVGNGEAAIKYIAPYLFRVAISDNNILSCKNGNVTFRYKPNSSNDYQILKLPATEFIRRFLQHLLPKGFQKIRYFGFLHPKNKKLLGLIRLLIKPRTQPLIHHGKKQTGFKCPDCGTLMRPMKPFIRKRAPPLQQILFEKTLALPV